MKNWKVLVDFYGKQIDIKVKAKSFSEAYLNASIKYPEGRILSIRETEESDKNGKNK